MAFVSSAWRVRLGVLAAAVASVATSQPTPPSWSKAEAVDEPRVPEGRVYRYRVEASHLPYLSKDYEPTNPAAPATTVFDPRDAGPFSSGTQHDFVLFGGEKLEAVRIAEPCPGGDDAEPCDPPSDAYVRVAPREERGTWERTIALDAVYPAGSCEGFALEDVTAQVQGLALPADEAIRVRVTAAPAGRPVTDAPRVTARDGLLVVDLARTRATRDRAWRVELTVEGVCPPEETGPRCAPPASWVPAPTVFVGGGCDTAGGAR